MKQHVISTSTLLTGSFVLVLAGILIGIVIGFFAFRRSAGLHVDFTLPVLTPR